MQDGSDDYFPRWSKLNILCDLSRYRNQANKSDPSTY